MSSAAVSAKAQERHLILSTYLLVEDVLRMGFVYPGFYQILRTESYITFRNVFVYFSSAPPTRAV